MVEKVETINREPWGVAQLTDGARLRAGGRGRTSWARGIPHRVTRPP
ncbi:hypothetical protein [Pandoraea communis]|nr:hypothetical protein [Pandoraea communis]